MKDIVIGDINLLVRLSHETPNFPYRLLVNGDLEVYPSLRSQILFEIV